MDDLSLLRLNLGVRDVATREGLAAPLAQVPETRSLAQEIFAKFGGKTQAESRQLVAILTAVQEVVMSQGMEVTPTAMFAALMASLEKPETMASSEVLAAMCHLLSLVLGRVPNQVLRSKFSAGSQVLCGILEAKQSDTAVAKHVLPCLGQMLAAFNHADWPSAVRPFNLLLSLTLDSRAKVRRTAQSAISDVLAGLQSSHAALGHASDAVLGLCQRVLPSPEAAAIAAAAAPSKKRQQAEEAIAVAVANTLHLLGALKQWIALLSAPAAAASCDLLLKLFPLRQPLLSRHATDVLTALCAAPGARLSASALSELLAAALGSEQLWEKRDPDATLAAIKLLEDGLCRLAALDPVVVSKRLPRAVHTLVPQLASDHEGVRIAAAGCLKNVINECVDEQAVRAALAGTSTGKQPPPLLSVLAALEASLGAHYQDAWGACLPVCAEMIEKLGGVGAPLATGLLEQIGELCAGGDDAAAAGAVDDSLLLAAQDALGTAMRALGPETVLAALPLNLSQGLAGSGEARTWLLPLLRLHVRGTRLGYWGKVLLPQARELGARAATAASNPAQAREAQVCSALEMQLWATLPSFCSWALDTSVAFKEYAKLLAAAFEKRTDLRMTICRALRRLCTQNRAVLAAAGQAVGFADPYGSTEEEEAAAGGQEEQAHGDIPADYTPDMALENVAALRALAKNWMPLLLTAFVATPAGQRTQLEQAISAYACCCQPAVTAQFFRAAVTKLIKVTEQAQTGELGPGAVLEGGDTDGERRATFLELCLALAGGLDAAGLETLYKAAEPGTKEKDASVQKKCYKVLAYLCEQRPDFLQAHFQQVVSALADARAASLSAAKRNRLRCLKAVVLAMARPKGPELEAGEEEGTSREEATKQMVASMVSEIILCVKERNKQTRATAFELLVQIAHAMHEAEPPPPGVDLWSYEEAMEGDGEEAQYRHRGGLHELFAMVLGGLVGATPHMISASVMALARLLYEFAPVLAGLVPDLLPAVLLLLRSKAREVIKSVLGFIKVVSLRLPAYDVARFLPQILEGCLLWAEDSKNKFRAKVRWIVEKLAKRCGFEEVAQHMPEAHSKLLIHIRKENSRRDRKRSEAGSQMEVDDVDEARSHKSRAETAARTARRSDWDEGVFSDSEGSGERTARTVRTRMTEGGRTKGPQQRRGGEAPAGLLAASRAGADPVDLLDAGASRQLVQAAGGKARRQRAAGDDGPDFETSAAGQMVIKDEKKRKRADDGWDSEDSDFEDLKGYERSGLALAVRGAKSLALAPSIAASLGGKTLGAKSTGALSRGGRSAGDRSIKSHGERSQKHQKGSQHSGDRFKAKKKGTGGDITGSAKVEPYAYWPLDRRLMNRRQQKSKGAKAGLDKIVVAAKQGAAKGSKAKRQKGK